MADMCRASTVDPISSGLVENDLTEAPSRAMLEIEYVVRHRVPFGAYVPHEKLVNELVRKGFDQRLVDRTIDVMVQRDELEWWKQRTVVKRIPCPYGIL